MTASVLSNWTQKMNIENQTVDWSHCAKSWRSFFIPKIKKGGQAQWQNLNPLTNSELILASGWNSPQWFFWRTLTPKRNELRRNLHRNSTSWNVWKTEKSFWNRSYRPQFRQKWKRSRSPAGPRRLRDSDTHKRIAVPKAFCVLRERSRPRPKSGNVRRSDTRPGEVCERAERSEGNDSAPSETPLFRRVGRCVRSCWRRRVSTHFRLWKRTWAICERSWKTQWGTAGG